MLIKGRVCCKVAVSIYVSRQRVAGISERCVRLARERTRLVITRKRSRAHIALAPAAPRLRMPHSFTITPCRLGLIFTFNHYATLSLC